MNISLTPYLEKYINKKVSSGLFNSASEVVREGLRLMIEQEELKASRFKELHKEIEYGYHQLTQGKKISGEEVFRELRQKTKNKNE